MMGEGRPVVNYESTSRREMNYESRRGLFLVRYGGCRRPLGERLYESRRGPVPLSRGIYVLLSCVPPPFFLSASLLLLALGCSSCFYVESSLSALLNLEAGSVMYDVICDTPMWVSTYIPAGTMLVSNVTEVTASLCLCVDLRALSNQAGSTNESWDCITLCIICLSVACKYYNEYTYDVDTEFACNLPYTSTFYYIIVFA